MNRRRTIPPKAGFTLLEILIAVAIFALVLAAINVVFYSALRLRRTAEAALEVSVPVQHALAQIKADLSHLVAPGQVLSGDFKSVPDNADQGQVGPNFYTGSAAIDETSPWSEVQRVNYALVASTNRTGGKDLVRLVTRNRLPAATDETMAQYLLTDVEALVFLYHDGNLWQSQWDSTTVSNQLPRAIKVQLALVQTNQLLARQSMPLTMVELVVPTYIETLTNQTSQADTNNI